MIAINNHVATPQNTPITVISHNKYGNKNFRAFGAYTLVGADGKKQYVAAHLEARGIGTPAIAKIAFNEWVRKEYGATVFFFSRDIKGVREGCYFKEVTDEVIPEINASVTEQITTAIPVAEVSTTAPKGVRVLVTGTNVSVFEDKEFKLELHNLIMKAASTGVTTIEFNNNGSLRTAFVELGKKLYAGYQQKGLQVYTCIVADGIHSGYFATIDTGSDKEPTTGKEVVPQESPAEVNPVETTEEVMSTVTPNVTETIVDADANSVKSLEPDAQVSSDTGDTIRTSEVSNAASEKNATSGYCCKKAVTAADFAPEEPSGKTEEEVWELLNGLF